MAELNLANPAVVGLGGFGTTTLLLQMHNFGLCGSGVVFCTAMAFGGGAQLMAGLQEFKTGNNFGYCAFSAYGAFWIALSLIFLMLELQAQKVIPDTGALHVTGTDLGWFLVAYTVFTFVLWIGSFAIHTAMVATFTTLIIGFIGLDLEFLAGMKSIKFITTVDLTICALCALYMMGHVIFNQVFGRDVWPVGKPWVKKG